MNRNNNINIPMYVHSIHKFVRSHNPCSMRDTLIDWCVLGDSISSYYSKKSGGDRMTNSQFNIMCEEIKRYEQSQDIEYRKEIKNELGSDNEDDIDVGHDMSDTQHKLKKMPRDVSNMILSVIKSHPATTASTDRKNSMRLQRPPLQQPTFTPEPLSIEVVSDDEIATGDGDEKVTNSGDEKISTQSVTSDDNFWRIIRKLNWVDRDEKKDILPRLSNITEAEKKYILPRMRCLMDSLTVTIGQLGESIEVQDNLVAHIIAKGKMFYLFAINNPDAISYLLETYHPLYTWLTDPTSRR